VNSVSCSSDGNCAAGGFYSDGGRQAFVVNEDRATFADVGLTNPFYTFVQWMASAGISAGTAQPSGKPLYKPADAVSRQAMALFMFRLSDDTETFTPPATPTFADVTSASHPQFYTAIEWMAAREISAGTAQPPGKPLFKPSDPVSRQAMALFVARYARADLTALLTTQRFADVPLGASSAAAIDWMFVNNISTGTAQPSGLPLYRPTVPVSRQAMAAFLFRVDGLP
jgi:serine protease